MSDLPVPTCVSCERETPRDKLYAVMAKKPLVVIPWRNIHGEMEEFVIVDWAMVCCLACARDVPRDYVNDRGSVPLELLDKMLIHVGNGRRMPRASARDCPETRGSVT